MKLRHKFIAATFIALSADYVVHHPHALHGMTEVTKAVRLTSSSHQHHHGGSGHVPSGGRAVYHALRRVGFSPHNATCMTAISGVESTWRPTAFNNDPATGDYSMGITQINYYGSLREPRTSWLGGPWWLYGHLGRQAKATAKLFNASGYDPWMPDITSGKIDRFLPEGVSCP